MPKSKKDTTILINYDDIGYYGRPITELTHEELLAAFADLCKIYKECERKNKKCKEILGDKKFNSL